ncbi:MAG: SpoVA/SpoVAEb family sporulation membrane protein [Bacilli bacterium]|nr:SpoVA/SpoVAEb family sporulation membrane protein [Bacilli bacterium]
MEKKRFDEMVKKHTPKEPKLLNLIKAFLIGGVIGVIGHTLLMLYTTYFEVTSKEAATYTIITLIFMASLFTAIGFFDSWVKFGKAGFIIPITGFAHAMTSSSLEYKREGLVTGIGSNIFKISGSVILYGIVSAYFFGLIRIWLFGG